MKNPFSQVRSIVVVITVLLSLPIRLLAQDEQERQFSPFDRVLVSDDITLEVSPGDKQLVRVKATASDQDKIITKLLNNTLIIRRDNARKREFTGGAVTVYVSLKNLTGLEAHSAAKIIGQAPFKAADFSLSVHEASSAQLDLTAQAVTINMGEGSNATLQLNTQALTGRLSQASHLNFKGNAGKQTVQTTEGSSIKQI